MSDKPAAAPPASPWAPFAHPMFRAMWIANIVSSIGTWMHEVGAGWLMVTLNPSPVMVALVQAATSLPAFFISVPAGALADIVDRRRYLIAAQVWMMTVAAVLAVVAYTGVVTAGWLLALTFLLSCGAAMMTPAWAATVPELVPRSELQSAVALNSTGVNIARAIGPAIAGIIVTAAGPAAAFTLNAVSFVGVIVVLWRWRRTEPVSELPPENFWSALRAGLRYARQAQRLHAVMIRSAAFFSAASAGWALLPLVARGAGGGAHTYGIMLACIGAGAVGGAVFLPRLRARMARDTLVQAATVLFAAAVAVLGLVHSTAALFGAALVAGMAWIAVVSSLHVSAQTAVPAWVRARALAIYLIVYSIAMSAGSVMWGWIASHSSIGMALAIAAAVLIAAALLTRRFKLEADTGGTTEAALWPQPQTHGEIEPDRGPVLITVEYRIDVADAAGFEEAARALEPIRRRDGARSWSLYHDAAQPGRYLETFVVESWAEHMRQHARATAGDTDVTARVRAFHRGPHAPLVSHLLAVNT